ncbi:MAG TPA: AraC family transcriptional regulator [Gemmatimonadaceae bacterium]|nr:AraC family transcriptional regulator [Gemmatimonadaceae bacterium]
MIQPPRIGAGDFVAWEGGCLLIGQAYRATGVHSHYAIQLSFGGNDGIRFRPSEREEWTEYPGVVITSRQPHAMDATPVSPSATFLIETETPAGRALAARFSREGISSVPRADFADAATRLFDTWKQHGYSDETRNAALQAVSAVARVSATTTVSDERVIRAIAYINAHLSGSLTLPEVAGQAFLSPSRFRHLFVDQTGTALRPYVLWRRFLRAWELIRAGDPISTAAHEAGFADAAHLTRTANRMFGFAPSALIVTGLQASQKSLSVQA